jgi:hypothetical protein
MLARIGAALQTWTPPSCSLECMTHDLHCPVCTGSNLTPVTLYKTQSTNKSLEVRFQGPDKSWADTGVKAYGITSARVCLDCGYVLAFVAGDYLERLRRELGTLTPIPADD